MRHEPMSHEHLRTIRTSVLVPKGRPDVGGQCFTYGLGGLGGSDAETQGQRQGKGLDPFLERNQTARLVVMVWVVTVSATEAEVELPQREYDKLQTADAPRSSTQCGHHLPTLRETVEGSMGLICGT